MDEYTTIGQRIEKFAAGLYDFGQLCALVGSTVISTL